MIQRLAGLRLPPLQRGNEAAFQLALEQWGNDVVNVLRALADGVDVMTDATRGSPVEGRVIFNSDDGTLNLGDGTNWVLPDGTTT